ncbi:hypothetical protein [Methylobacterium sp. Leaf456]|uniref:hypothetical protein n=1 Tax=Methylobacterium sp. Leaf456 TaxID=1736382 RepID=UPI000AFAC9E0|nr:hypothetical protein [Methylobacterium sp. Leaf456]
MLMVMYAIFMLPTFFLGTFVLVKQNRVPIRAYIFLVIITLIISGSLSYYIFDYVTPDIKSNPGITFKQKMKSSNIVGVSIFTFLQSAILLTALWLLRRWDQKTAENSN